MFQNYSHHMISSTASVLVAEANALKAGLEAVVAKGIKEVICYSDSKSFINLITGNKSIKYPTSGNSMQRSG
ncbi:hypothetical protein IGI04_018324 [Brassica rapa subsp. trilocularis]|uniref:RNase H type-1 domain-containing protein n=1 Tax=Brassica rapa subsp. trilocularis TaxID=1813537 RepID=A0ABQ7MCL9_BRACM|nr:hypothetical protein IGI04_018324 [Brassica rapa subsp. trilocularis]